MKHVVLFLDLFVERVYLMLDRRRKKDLPRCARGSW